MEVTEEQYYQAYEEFLIFVAESGLDREYPTQQEMEQHEVTFMKRMFNTTEEIIILGEY